jgi:hypothetical protein
MGDLSNDNHWSTSRSTILHFWQQGHRNAAEIARITKIPERTLRYNITKIQYESSVEYRGGNGRTRKITRANSVLIGQWLRQNNEINSRKLPTSCSRHKILTYRAGQCRASSSEWGIKAPYPRQRLC